MYQALVRIQRRVGDAEFPGGHCVMDRGAKEALA